MAIIILFIISSIFVAEFNCNNDGCIISKNGGRFTNNKIYFLNFLFYKCFEKTIKINVSKKVKCSAIYKIKFIFVRMYVNEWNRLLFVGS